MIGQKISHYEILEKLGQGGMGVVYKARDTKLDRVVALKFLPPHLGASAPDKARFIQEAKAASALNHPNVCTIHDIQDHGDQMFIVMEFVDGQLLRDKVGTVATRQAIDIGIQIADGLAAAHERGIVHRDIKPENIMIRKDGIVQIMDFGLAKLRDSSSKITRLTKEGSTVGTAGYMSPEQIQGQDADHRSDIFSFGVLLYELFTGQLPFKGVHETALAYEIVNVDAAPMSSVKAEIDPNLDAIVLECLEKDPRERTQSAAQIGIDLKRYRRESSRQRASRITAARPVVRQTAPIDTQDAPSGDRMPAADKKQGIFPWLLSGALFVALVAAGYLHFAGQTGGQVAVHAFIDQPEKMNFCLYGNSAGPVMLSPDGTNLAFVATDSIGRRYLYVRALDDVKLRRLPETDGAMQPFWSPDGRSIGFAANGMLRKIDIAGGSPMTICRAAFLRGASWNEDGTIIYTPGPSEPLYTVSAKGGTPARITHFDSLRKENSHRWPFLMPDGKHVLYLARAVQTGSQSEGDAICAASLDGKENKLVIHASSNAIYIRGYLLFAQLGTLLAQKMDEKSFELSGDPIQLATGVAFDASTDRFMFTATANGILVYQTGAAQLGSKLTFFDRSGRRTGAFPDLQEYYDPRLSPDQKKIATWIYDFQSHNADVWLLDLARGLKTRFTFSPSYERFPIYSPDANQVVYSSNVEGVMNLYRKPASGSGTPELLLKTANDKLPRDWSSDGKYLLYSTVEGTGQQSDIWMLPMAGDRKPFPYLKSEFNELDGHFSPDVHWVAYVSDESGQFEVYIRNFPDQGSKWQVSVAGGASPRWRKDGKELYYFGPDNKLMVADIEVKGNAVEVSHVRPLFEAPSIVALPYPDYDVSGDGKQFVMNVPFESQNPSPLTLVTNWTEELKKK